ncbi:MAG TPA: GNAT family protein [candidate division Zixibacteria bacterium]|nr:GNAT family protein [candidate division Zixibacteria bacterium]
MDIKSESDTNAQPPAYRIETSRLVLRCWQPADAKLLQEAVSASREHLLPWMDWAHAEPESLQTRIDCLRRFRAEFDLGQDFIYAIFNRDESKVLGGSGLHTRVGSRAREIGYWVHVDHVGKGLATEATKALIKVAFEIDGIERIEIRCDPENTASAAVPEKLGFHLDGILRKSLPQLDGSLRDTMMWTLLREEYPNSLSAELDIKAFDVIGRRLL